MRRKATKFLLEKLLPQGHRNKEQTETIFNLLLQGRNNKNDRRSLYLKGVHRGRFYRVKLPPPTTTVKEAPSHLPELPLPGGPMPHAFKSVRPTTSNHHNRVSSKSSSSPETSAAQAQNKNSSNKNNDSTDSYFSMDTMRAWWNENWATMVLNFGSICTLIGFTRSDVLELRCLSVTGSTASVIYSLTRVPKMYLPVAWSSLFATVNGFKIREILQERHQKVHMTDEEEGIYDCNQ